MRENSTIVRRSPAAPQNSRFLSGAYPTPSLERGRTGERVPGGQPARMSSEPPSPAEVACSEDAVRNSYNPAMALHTDLVAHDELRAVAALAELPRELLAELATSSSQRRVHAGVSLVEQGATAGHLDVLVRGAVKVVRTTKHALGESTVVLEVARAPAILLGASFFDGQPESAGVVALRSSQVIALDRRVVMRLASLHPAFARALHAHLAAAIRRHVRRIDEVASGPVDDRVRHLLEGLAHEHGTPFGGGRFIAIPLRRKDIACMVNATTETVSRVLARFEREGLTRSTRDGIWLRVAPGSAAAHPRTRPDSSEFPSPSVRPSTARADESGDLPLPVPRAHR